MRFLVDEDLPRLTKNLLQRYKHEAVDVRDIGLRGAKDYQIATYAQVAQIPGKLAIVEPSRVRIRIA